MKINFAAALHDLDGKPLLEEGLAITLGVIACRSLMATFNDEQSLGAEVKVKRFKMALDITRGDDQDIPVEDVAELKRLIGKAYGPLIVGRCYEIIEPGPST